MKRFRKVHIEITNICNLKCTFCPPKILPNKTMTLDKFDKLNLELKEFTTELAYHIVGDPLVLSNLDEYLNISLKHNLKVNITTTANNINKKHYETLLNPTIKQINFSINSYNANSHKKSLDEYLEPIIEFVKFAQKQKHEYFINFRIWNLDEKNSAKEFNLKVFNKINEAFDTNIDIEDVYKNRPKNIRIDRKIFFNFDEYFNWPNLENKEVSKTGFCYGLDSHFGVLSNGDVVPCCLDKDAIINLGNIEDNSLKNILTSKRVKDIQNGFKKDILVEELCQKCEYRTRFDKRLEDE
ncbi:SPASM domain-containing protein [Aliarcobacter butzleri]|uniref:radical SAM/SPASM domain-containing protein n=1 Tax=Aliarcobacter butzleri TaxID=28197 RepID=UPI001260D9FF|nr:SPASM domain-containing protein [Aliarcobacter butzleri]MCT7563849.1 SPASM domain-containing protein [Aliarcobacter butzleri]MCT7612422.1 SPASM domain-containing protein [Aliarcobacter butzleri]MCT7621513.1 SPASM domain-containing protein [Aliarcobacter butzleri]